MAFAKPIPRKYLTLLTEAQDVLRLIASIANTLIEEMKEKEELKFSAESSLREIETKAYRTALDLSEIEVAGSCDTCPLGPPVTEADARLIVLVDALEQITKYARQKSKLGELQLTQ